MEKLLFGNSNFIRTKYRLSYFINLFIYKFMVFIIAYCFHRISYYLINKFSFFNIFQITCN